MSLVDFTVARSPYLAAMASCDQGASAISRLEGVLKFLVDAVLALSCRLPLNGLLTAASLLDALLPSDEAELAEHVLRPHPQDLGTGSR